MTIEDVARTCHEVNRAYCLALGDTSQKSWDEAPDWQRRSAILGAELHLKNPDASPSDSHNSWLAQKEKEGWKFGPFKDEIKKEHPRYLPYKELPITQKAKDFIFRQVVHSLARFVHD